MVLAKYLRLALLGTALVASQAQATFDFNKCVSSCVHSSGCATDDAKCVCKEARSVLMESVISCLYFNCKSDLPNFEDAFLEPIVDGCEDLDREIPSSKIKSVESLGSSYASKLPSATTADETTKDKPKPTPKTTTKLEPTAAKTTTAEEESATSTTSTPGSGAEETSTPAAGQTITETTLILAPTSTGQTSAGSSNSDESDDSEGGADTNPFGSPGSAGSAVRPFVSLLGLSLAAGMLALR